MIRLLLLFGLVAIGWLVFLRRNRLPVHIVTVFALLGAAALAVMFPDATSQIANFVGVGRGADLVTYMSIVTAMFVLVHYYTKFVELQTHVTVLTREIAALRAELDRARPQPAEGPTA